MRHWEELRRTARELHAATLAASGGDPSAAALLAAAERLSGVARVPVPAGDALLDGADALLDAATGVIIYAHDVEPWHACFYQAHEFAHLWLDDSHAACARADLEAGLSEDSAAGGAARVEGYSPRERCEREANVVALEFLLPGPVLRRWFREDGLDAAAIAARTGLPASLVCAQLARALLLPAAPDHDRAAAGVVTPDDLNLDAAQRRAAHAPRGPLLLEAGPGTGKTRTLVARVLYLLREGVPASSILALTFSRRAAEEMRERVAVAAPVAAPALWLGTFHAFGLELLRKYGAGIGLPPAPTVLDPLDALAWLERRLPALDLVHYHNLYQPDLPLRDMLAAIARAKDELVGPEEYAALAGRMRDAASTEQERERAARALEVARVYAVYEDGLRRAGLLDFGDLIARVVALLREQPDVRAAARRAFPHILVDEYQDMNRASALLLRELAGDGAGLWVVGDTRQAIYRFRGAAPENMRLFATDFPGATVLALHSAYRAQPAIVAAVSEAASRMGVTSTGSCTSWMAQRGVEGGEARLEVATDGEAEIEGLARTIQARHAGGLAYADQAVLCRSHTALARVAAGLERAGVPVFYPGALFERPEARDMLALLSLACSGDGQALLRVARFAEYDVPPSDVRALLALARERAVPFPRALALVREAPEVSPRGRAGLALLARHLDALPFGADAWSTLARYLFQGSGYLRALLDDATAQQRRLALYQFLQVARDWRVPPDDDGADPTRAFLRQVRRLVGFGEEGGLEQLPDWAGGIDAVLLLTVHASKGLEFAAVYLPVMAQRYFPAPRRWEPCPPPEGMLADDAEAMHAEEEDCLFFVAISRARDLLCLSYARRYGRQNSKPSRLLSLIAETLPAVPDGAVTWPASGTAMPRSVTEAARPEDTTSPAPSESHMAPTTSNVGTPAAAQRSSAVEALEETAGVHSSFAVEALELYLRCPRRFYYEQVLDLPGRDVDDGYAAFRHCVHDVVAWLQQQAAQGQAVGAEAALARLHEVWQAAGPREQRHEALYQRAAEAMVRRALDHLAGSGEQMAVNGEWAVELPHGRVTLQPQPIDSIDEDGARSVVVRRLRTGSGGGESQKRQEALHHAAVERAYPDLTRRVQTVSLATGEARDAADPGATAITARLEQYDGAITGILNRAFAPRPEDRRCARCPHYFLCPLDGEQ